MPDIYLANLGATIRNHISLLSMVDLLELVATQLLGRRYHAFKWTLRVLCPGSQSLRVVIDEPLYSSHSSVRRQAQAGPDESDDQL